MNKKSLKSIIEDVRKNRVKTGFLPGEVAAWRKEGQKPLSPATRRRSGGSRT